MGCHTWIHKRCQTPIEELKQKALRNIEESMLWWASLSDEEILRLYPPGYEELNASKIREENKKRDVIYKRRIEKGYIGTIAAFANTCDDPSLEVHKGIIYEDIGCYDHFRIGGYPTDVLLSKEETLKFIEDNKDKMSFLDNYLEKIDEFWDQYPDGMICFG